MIKEDILKLRLTDSKIVVKPKSLDELSKEIEHYESLYARTKQPPVLEIINNLKEEHLALEIKLRPDEWKKYNSSTLGTVMNLNLTKEEIHCEDGAFYTFEEFGAIPSNINDDQRRLIHQVKLFGCKKSAEYEEPTVYETI